MSACDRCLRRADLVAAITGWIEIARRGRPVGTLLALCDEDLLVACGRTRVAERYAAFDPGAARAALAAAGTQATCRCADAFPRRLEDLPDPPAVLFSVGAQGGLAGLHLDTTPAVGVVGARRASAYGLDVARRLGRGLAAAGVRVVSGMALGVDSAAHAGALDGGGHTVAVLAGPAAVPYPPSKAALHRAIRARGAVLSELPPGASARRWTFPARNRTIAALSDAVVVVEAAERSGSLITATLARELGRDVGAVPGPVTAPGSCGANALLADGAHLVRGVQDVLDLLFGAGARTAADPAAALPPPLRALLDAVAGGADTLAALGATGTAIPELLDGLAELELRGLVHRGPAGRYLRRA